MVSSGIWEPETENLVSLGSMKPRDLRLSLVHHYPGLGSMSSHSQTSTQGHVESVWQSSTSARLVHWNSGGMRVFSPSLYSPMLTALTMMSVAQSTTEGHANICGLGWYQKPC